MMPDLELTGDILQNARTIGKHLCKMNFPGHLKNCCVLAIALSITPKAALGCSCISPPPGIKDTRALAASRAERVDTIFEGIVQSGRLDSRLLQGPGGDLVPACLDEDAPKIIVSFATTRWYKGVQQDRVEVETGLGGGDCGFPFEVGKQYLVYAYRDQTGQLSTGICTGTDQLEESQINLAYLRGDHIPATDLSTGNGRQSAFAAGKICGKIETSGFLAPTDDPRIRFMRVGSVSPFPSEEAEVDPSGAFCSRDLQVGEYRVLFTNTVGEVAFTSFSYYPGVTQIADAARIEVKPQKNVPDLLFRIPLQQTFSVAGKVTTSDNSPVPANTKVILLTADGSFIGPAYGQDVSSDGAFAIQKVLPPGIIGHWSMLTRIRTIPVK